MATQSRSITARKVIVFLLCIAVPLVTGIISSLQSGNVRTTYDGFAKPPLAPPNWLFGVVWPVLYILMGIALYLIIAADVSMVKKVLALGLFVLQLVVNAMWSPVFFGSGLLWGAVIVIVLMDLLVIATLMAFNSIRPLAAVLMVPYLIWIVFATYLNIGIAILN